MADLFAWLLSFFLLVATLAIVLYQVMCLSDLELDYINPYDSASQINKAVFPEFVTQGSLCLLHLLTGHWLMFLICLPHSYYNFRFSNPLLVHHPTIFSGPKSSSVNPLLVQ
ncbi:protein cornichon homolog 4-like isoform X2 [Rhododendron vialii]|uniref:protein cornichon homolog 4-like isoform X2 n=1 Tax=Rhododendron vialii TaxID=182163 RepID=UPI00265E9C33|nr:protein cornichon homolog 4-like isoform X2 [Rhododendron vialii]